MDEADPTEPTKGYSSERRAAITRARWASPEGRAKMLATTPETRKRVGRKNADHWKDPERRAQMVERTAPLLSCRYCQREIRHSANVARHERTCTENPERLVKPRPDATTKRTSPEHSVIYGLIDPRTSEMRYVGWTVNPRSRLRRHMGSARAGRKGGYVLAWIREVLADGLEPQMVILETNPSDYAMAERDWIRRYRSWGCRLTNLSDGGDGSPGYRHTPEERRRISTREKGKKLSPATRAKISAASKGRVKSPEERAKLSAAHKGKKKSPEHRAAIRRAANRRDNAYVIARNKTVGMRQATAARNRTAAHKAAVAAGRAQQSPDQLPLF